MLERTHLSGKENCFSFLQRSNFDETQSRQILLGKGASPDTPDANGVTPTMVASSLGRLVKEGRTAGFHSLILSLIRTELVKLFLDAGSDPNITDNAG